MKKYKCNGRPSDDLDLTDLQDVIFLGLAVIGFFVFIGLAFWG